MQDSPVVTRFIDPATKQPAIGLMKPTQDVFALVFRNTIVVGKSHRVPTRDGASQQVRGDNFAKPLTGQETDRWRRFRQYGADQPEGDSSGMLLPLRCNSIHLWL
jgi:hypothetical protein